MNMVKTERGTIAGGISIIIIFITLCIAIYGLLAVFVAGNELELNKKNREASEDYYAADAAAAKIISEIASARFGGRSIYESDGINILYGEPTVTVSFSVPIDKFRELAVFISFPENGGIIKIDRYQVTSNLKWHEQTKSRIEVITDFDD